MKRVHLICYLLAIMIFFHAKQSDAEPSAWIAYDVECNLIDGKASFEKLYLPVMHIEILNAGTGSNGILTIKGGHFLYGVYSEYQENKLNHAMGNDVDIALKYGFHPYSPNPKKVHHLVDPARKRGIYRYLFQDDEGRLSAESIEYKIDKTSGSIDFPKFRSLTEQLNSYVPYIEYVLDSSDKMVTGIIVRFVKPDNPAEAIIRDVTMEGITVGSLVVASKKLVHINKSFKEGEAAETLVTLDPPIAANSIPSIGVLYKNTPNKAKYAELWYSWRYHNLNVKEPY
jgi:hypothetical protein